jgi:hypothetical protein
VKTGVSKASDWDWSYGLACLKRARSRVPAARAEDAYISTVALFMFDMVGVGMLEMNNVKR